MRSRTGSDASRRQERSAEMRKPTMLTPLEAGVEEEDRQFVTALARGLEVLRCFTPTENTLGNQEIARKTGLPKPTVSRLTHTLVRLGYLRQDALSGLYQLDIGILRLGYAMLSNLMIRTVASPLMQVLADYAKAAVAMAARDRLSMVYLDVVQGEGNMTMRRQIGSTLPLAGSSVGRACLAAMPEDERTFILEHIREREPENWPSIRKGLDRALRDFEDYGYCLSIGEWHRDVNSVAVPLVHKQYGVLVFNCGGPSFQLPREKLEDDIGPRLIEMVHNISSAVP
ncbi:IclR family transcriptional regulator [Brucella melitensis]|uniref:IclR family transcriptional regulator n=1 Tax=Brucella melitensis TaxID=29459 RepID=UPI001932DF1E|nr:IclR family transcriptional regulator [Brucella melitensis]MBM0582358.1 IclR family transcriptional regulator [Brucella melitensis]